jgi:hypothetical protein
MAPVPLLFAFVSFCWSLQKSYPKDGRIRSVFVANKIENSARARTKAGLGYVALFNARLNLDRP